MRYMVAILFAFLCLNPIMGQAQVANFETQACTRVTTSSLENLLTSATGGGDATIAVTTETSPSFIRPITDTKAIKFNVTGAGTVSSTWNMDVGINMPLTGVNTLHMAYYVTNTNPTTWNMSWLVAETSAYSNFYTYSPYAVAPNLVRTGWNLATVRIDTPSSTSGSPQVGNTFQRIRIQMVVPSGVTGTIYLGSIYANCKNRPKVVFTFDDNDSTQWDEGFIYLNRKGLKGSWARQTSLAGVTLNQMKYTVDNLGWSIHNHSHTHPDMTALTQPQCVTEIQNAQNILLPAGLGYGNSTFIYPQGFTNATVEAALAQFNMRNGAIVRTQIEKYWDGLEQPYRINRWATDQTQSLVVLKAAVDQAIAYSGGIVFYTHAILTGATGSNTEKATWQGLVDYVKLKQDQGVLDVVNFQEFIDGMTKQFYNRQAYALPN